MLVQRKVVRITFQMIHTMRKAIALTVTVEVHPGGAQKLEKQKVLFNGLTGKIITPCFSVLLPSIACAAAPTAEEVAQG
jgi:hypothetical protein